MGFVATRLGAQRVTVPLLRAGTSIDRRAARFVRQTAGGLESCTSDRNLSLQVRPRPARITEVGRRRLEVGLHLRRAGALRRGARVALRVEESFRARPGG